MDGDQKIGKSSSGKGDLGSGVNDSLGLVLFGESVSVLNGVVDISLRDSKGFSVPKAGWGVVVFLWVLGNDTSGDFSQRFPVGGGEWKFEVIWLSIDDRVPDGVKVAGTIDRWKLDSVSSEVTTWVFVVDS